MTQQHQNMARRQTGPLGTKPLELEDLVELTGFSIPELAEMARPGGVAAGVDTAGLVTFCLAAKARGLDPRKKQCYYIQRGGNWTFNTGIDGFSAVAARSKRDGGVSAPYYRGHVKVLVGRDRNGKEAWLDVPEEAEVVVYKLVGPNYNARAAFTGVATWSEYAPADMTGAGATMWRKMPRRMLSKCAAAQAYRYAFPEELGDVGLSDEPDGRTLDVSEAERQSQPVRELGDGDAPKPARTYEEVFESEESNQARIDEHTAQAHAVTERAHAAAAERDKQLQDLDEAEAERQRRQEGLL